MSLTKQIPAPIVLMETERFQIRELTVDDVSMRYLAWLDDPITKKWILAAETTQQLSDLRLYVQHRTDRGDVLFLGIFDKSSGMHIGNIKYEPIVREMASAVMGILIGEPLYRGIGVFGEVFKQTSVWLKQHRQVKNIFLGVEANNFAATKTYLKADFRPVKLSAYQVSVLGNVSMVYRI